MSVVDLGYAALRMVYWLSILGGICLLATLVVYCTVQPFRRSRQWPYRKVELFLQSLFYCLGAAWLALPAFSVSSSESAGGQWLWHQLVVALMLTLGANSICKAVSGIQSILVGTESAMPVATEALFWRIAIAATVTTLCSLVLLLVPTSTLPPLMQKIVHSESVSRLLQLQGLIFFTVIALTLVINGRWIGFRLRSNSRSNSPS